VAEFAGVKTVYFVAQKYVEAIGGIASAPNQRVVLFPVEASNFIGSLGGIAEIAKSVFGDDDSRARGGNGTTRRPAVTSDRSGDPAGPWNDAD
jgi:hypothetical protein